MISTEDAPALGEPLTAEAVFDAEALMRRVQTDGGMSDWGDTPFEDALQILCRAVRKDRARPPRAVNVFSAEIRRLLGQRLQLAAARKLHPEIPQQRIARPIIVLGLPRSGTTILHSLLSADPSLRSPLKWELDQPFPPPRSDTFETDPRIQDAEVAVAKLDSRYRAMHQIGARLPMECNTIQAGSFRSLDFTALLFVPSYADWLIHEADMAPAYAYHTQFLQHLQAFAPRERWVLKGPTHMFWPGELFKAYPDACIVMTHRDPAQIIASNSSLITHIRGMLEPANGAEVAQESMAWSIAVRRFMEFRDARHTPEQFFDVRYTDFLTDPMAVICSMYAHFGLPLTAEAETSMKCFMADNEQEKHGKHIYDAADFGLRPDEIRSSFVEYLERFNLR